MLRYSKLRYVLALSAFWLCGSLYAGAVPPGGESGATGDSSDLILLIAYVSLALVFSFACSVAEAVLLSITPSYIAGMKEQKPELAATLKRLKQDNVDQSLAAILTLNTIAHTVGAIGSGAKATAVFGSAWFGLFSAVMTLMILFFSEIIPKTLGAVYWRSLSRPTAFFVRWLIIVLYPLIWVSERLTRLVASGTHGHGFNREEYVAMAGIGAEAGKIHQHETRVIGNLFQLDALKARDVMTPRTVIQAYQKDLTVADVIGPDAKLPFSRLPIYTESLDDANSFVLRADVLLALAEGRKDATLSSIKRDLPTVPSDTSLSNLLEFLLDHRQHIALVVEEFGAAAGLVTLEDVVETLLGIEIVDEMDTVEDMQQLARERWKSRAKARGLTLDE